jgi:hypothetical protein
MTASQSPADAAAARVASEASSLIGNTPMVRLDRLADGLAAEVVA